MARPTFRLALWDSAAPRSDSRKPCWERLRALDYQFLRDEPENAAAIALRFTLSLPGVHTAIVGTANPTRWRQNAALLAAGPLEEAQLAAIRARWNAVAGADWIGQI